MNKLRFQNLRQRLVFVQESTIVVVNKEGNIGLRHLLKIRKIFDGKLTGLIESVSSLTLSLETNSIGQTIRVIAKIVITSMINSNDARRAGNQNGNQCHIFVTSQGTMKRNLRENTGLKSKEPVNCILLTGNGPHFQRVDSRIKNVNARREIVPLRIFVRRVINQIDLTPNDIRMIVLNDTRIEILQMIRFNGVVRVYKDRVLTSSKGDATLPSDRNTSIAKMVDMNVRIGRCVFVQNLRSSVSRTIVNNNQLIIREGLRENAINTLVDVRLTVETRQDDREFYLN